MNGIDESLIKLLGERVEICRQVAYYKRDAGVPMMQPKRVEQVKDRCATMGEAVGLDATFVRDLYTLIIKETCRVEDEIIDAP